MSRCIRVDLLHWRSAKDSDVAVSPRAQYNAFTGRWCHTSQWSDIGLVADKDQKPGSISVRCDERSSAHRVRVATGVRHEEE